MILKPCPSNQSKSKKTSLGDVSKNNPEGLFRGVRIISSPPHLVTKCMTLSRVHAYRELRWFWARIHQSDQRPDNRMSVRKILSDYRVVFNVPELICTHWSAIQSQALNMFNIFNVHNCSKWSSISSFQSKSAKTQLIIECHWRRSIAIILRCAMFSVPFFSLLETVADDTCK